MRSRKYNAYTTQKMVEQAIKKGKMEAKKTEDFVKRTIELRTMVSPNIQTYINESKFIEKQEVLRKEHERNMRKIRKTIHTALVRKQLKIKRTSRKVASLKIMFTKQDCQENILKNRIQNLTLWIPRKYRGDIRVDLLDDIDDAKELGCSKLRIHIHVYWQLAIAILMLVPETLRSFFTRERETNDKK